MVIVTNNVPRLVIDWNQLTDDEKSHHDYLTTDDEQSEATFVRYRGWAYNVGEFMRLESDGEMGKQGWHGGEADTYFSGTLIRIVEDDPDYVVMGRWYE